MREELTSIPKSTLSSIHQCRYSHYSGFKAEEVSKLRLIWYQTALMVRLGPGDLFKL